MSFCKLITTQILLIFSVISVFFIPNYIPIFTSNPLLKHQNEKGMSFFLVSAFPVLNALLYIFFNEFQGRKSKKNLKTAFYDSVSLYFITFINIISAYIFKVDFSVILKIVVFIVINNQLYFISTLLQYDALKYYFCFNILISNLILLGFSFFNEFEEFSNRRVNEILKYKNILMKYFYK